MSTLQRIAEAARRYAQEIARADQHIKPHAYQPDPHSSAGNCALCHRPKRFWAHWRG